VEDRLKKSLGENPNRQNSDSAENEQSECPKPSSENAGEKTPQSICEDIHDATESLEAVESVITVLLGGAKEIAMDLVPKAVKAGTAALARDNPGSATEGAETFAGAVADQSITLSTAEWLNEYVNQLKEYEKELGAGGEATKPTPNPGELLVTVTKLASSFLNDHFCGSVTGPMDATILAVATLNHQLGGNTV
jgi:hypothetical protein